MALSRTHSAWLLILTTGCAATPSDPVLMSAAPPLPSAESLIQRVDYTDTQPDVKQPASSFTESTPELLATPIVEQAVNDRLTIEAIEQQALAYNPAIAQSSARVRALQGKWVQVGLPPNPSAGYTASEIGDDGAAGQQGGFVGQEFITANKLQRNRAIVAAEITAAEQQLTATQQRVLTDVRIAYYQTLLAQRRHELADQLLRVTTEAVDASKSLVDAEEVPLAGLLQTEIRKENSRVLLRTAKNAQEQAWRRLSAVVSGPPLQPQPLEGNVTTLPMELHWEEQLARLQAESPEVAAALAQVEQARRSLNRAGVEAVPDIATQLSTQYDYASGYAIVGVQVGMPIPLWNRNQGGIRQAQAEITQAERNLQRVEQDLNQRLADAFRSYSDAHITAANYAADILPRSEQTLNLVRKGYEQGEVGYLDLLAAQQTYSETNLAYLDALGELWRNYVLIDGMLLDSSLATLSP